MTAAAEFVIFQDVADEWRFRLVAANGEVIAASEGYVSRENAERGARDVVRAVNGGVTFRTETEEF